MEKNIMIDDRKTQNNDNLISDTTFWDLYPVDLSSIETVEIQSLPLSVRVLNRLRYIGVRTVADLYRMKVDVFINMNGVGKKCYDETCKYLSDLSNQTIELKPRVSPIQSTTSIPQIIVDNVDNILNQDFSFCNDLNADSDDLLAVEKYKDAIEIIGTDLARVCYYTPNKILPLMGALKPLIKAHQEYQYRKNKIQEQSECPRGKSPQRSADRQYNR
jgi:hypothetical protein